MGSNTVSYVVVTGGVISGLGKGTFISSLGALLRYRGLDVTAVKIDPYLNVDAGTIAPSEHGEVYVLSDGSEVDLDLGCYERFLGVELTSAHSITSGKVYAELHKRERRGDYLGKTVQVVPHATDLVRHMIESTAKKALPTGGVCLVELGGTVGDIESMLYLRAICDMRNNLPRSHFMLVHVSLIPYISHEQKTKPTQHSVSLLRQAGLFPEMLVCRCESPLYTSTRSKLKQLCQIEHIISLATAKSLYHVPTMLRSQHVHSIVCASLGGLRPNKCIIEQDTRSAWWESVGSYVLWTRSQNLYTTVAIVGKYVAQQSDAYLSLKRALIHAGHALKIALDICWIDTDDKDCLLKCNKANAIIVPGGFGKRGFDTKVKVIHQARNRFVPFLGICFGFQAAVVEYARYVLGDTSATTEEFGDPTSSFYVVKMPETCTKQLGGTMRLGLKQTKLTPRSQARKVYGTSLIAERHRHRYEVNPTQVSALEQAGLQFTGRSLDGRRMEVLELHKTVHPYFIGTQYHPEYKSSYDHPNPLFIGLLSSGLVHAGGKYKNQ